MSIVAINTIRMRVIYYDGCGHHLHTYCHPRHPCHPRHDQPLHHKPDEHHQHNEQAKGLSERYLEEILRAAALHGYVQFCPSTIFVPSRHSLNDPEVRVVRRRPGAGTAGCLTWRGRRFFFPGRWRRLPHFQCIIYVGYIGFYLPGYDIYNVY